MQPQSKAALEGQRHIANLKSHRFYSPEHKANVSRTEINEHYLMSRLARGDVSAFRDLWEQYRGYLYICCLRWLGTNRYDVDDALSRASIKAINGLLNNGHNITHLKGWLSRLTHNICMDIIRERNRRRRSLYRIGELAEIGEWQIAYSPPSAEEALLQGEMAATVRRAVNVLPCRLQLPSMMRFFQEMPYQDIARQLKITPATARKRIQQARAIIQDHLDPYLRGTGDPISPSKEEDNPDENTCELPSDKSDIEDLENDTIKPCIAPYRLIRATLRSEMEMQYYIPIKNMPKRIHQKIRTLKKYVRKHPRSWKKRLKLADFLYITGDWPDAVDNYRLVLDKKPSFFQVWLQLGNILHLMGEEGYAVAAFERTHNLARNSATRHYVFGLIEICRGQYRKANDHIKKAASLESDNSAHWHAQGVTLLHTNKPVKALLSLDHALEINPKDTVALINSSDALKILEKPKESLRRLDKALDISQDDVLGLLRMAQYRVSNGLVFKPHGTETRNLIREALSLAPQSIDALGLLAIFYKTKGDIDQGTSVFQKIIELHTTNPYARFNYALWLSYLYDCGQEINEGCSVRVYPKGGNELDWASWDHILSIQYNENICTALKEKLNCRPERWSIYATDGISWPT